MYIVESAKQVSEFLVNKFGESRLHEKRAHVWASIVNRAKIQPVIPVFVEVLSDSNPDYTALSLLSSVYEFTSGAHVCATLDLISDVLDIESQHVTRNPCKNVLVVTGYCGVSFYGLLDVNQLTTFTIVDGTADLEEDGSIKIGDVLYLVSGMVLSILEGSPVTMVSLPYSELKGYLQRNAFHPEIVENDNEEDIFLTKIIAAQAIEKTKNV